MSALQRKFFGGKRRRRRSSPAPVRRRRRSSGSSSRVVRRRRRRGGGGGSSPFRSGGGIVRRLTSSAVPVAKTVVPIVLGAVLAAFLAKKVAPKLKNNTTYTGVAVTAAAILLGTMARKLNRLPGGSRAVSYVAIGAAADGVMRLAYNLRQKSSSALAVRGNQGLLADVVQMPDGTLLNELDPADQLMALQ